MSWLRDAAIVIAIVCLSVAGVTLLISVVRYKLDHRRKTIRRQLLPELFARLGQSDPDWQEWYDDHSRFEQYVVRRVIAQYLRRLRGSERKQLQSFATGVGIDDRAVAQLKSRLLTTQLRGLIWLTLLDRPVPVDLLRTTSLDHPSTRSGAARLLYTAGTPDASDDGTALLLWQGDGRLSVFALDTLYRLNRVDASALTSKLVVDGQWWDDELVLQCLIVLAHCPIERRDDLHEWLATLLDHDSPEIRAAALSAYEQQGWQPEIRAQVDVEQVLADPNPSVRIACYELLGRWGDSSSIEWLRYAVVTDPNDRCRLTAARTLVRADAALPTVPDTVVEADEAAETAVEYVKAIDWARAEGWSPRRAAAGWP